MNTKNKIAMVTGASSGIGQATAERLTKAGYEVYGTSRRGATTDQRSFEMVPLDVTSDESVEAAVREVMRRSGRIDVLVNNAGFSVAPAGAEESSLEQARSIFDTNFFGIVRMTRAVVPHMRHQGGGRILNIGSVLGFLPAPYMALYAATKHAIEGYSESLDHELRTWGIRISVIEPAYTKTAFDANALEPDSKLEEYREACEALGHQLRAIMATADEPGVVADVVLRAALAVHPKARYTAGSLANRLRWFRRFAPAGLIDAGIRKSLRLDELPDVVAPRSGPQPATGARMRALVIRRYRAPMEMMDLPRPEPGPGDLLVRVRAAGVNPLDYKIRDGVVKVLTPYTFPLILGTDLAGDVEAIGPGVTRFKVGDAIYARLDKDRIGAIAEYAVVREGAAARKPARLDYVQAASLPLVGLTAWQALIEVARLQTGQKILIHAGSGGVGTFAIQLAKHLGAKVTTTAGARNHALVTSLGADLAIDYKTTRFEDVAKGQDAVLDSQAGDTLLRSFEAVRPGGVVVTIGGRPDGKFARAWGLSLPLVWILGFLNREVDRVARQRNVRFEYLFMRASGEQLERIGALVDEGVIKPVLDRTFPLEAAAEAISYVESGHAVGKVVIRVDDSSPATG